MGGGLLNIVAYGNQNVRLNGNPSKTFFKTTYAKYTNFGLQKFRLDFEGQKTLRERSPSTYKFTVSRYADLLVDTYFVIDFPNIWSPIYMPSIASANGGQPHCQPYEFRWIENLGAQLIKWITVSVGGHIIQQYSGQYLFNMVKRDFSQAKQDLFNEMTGNVPEMYDPANAANNQGVYPSVMVSGGGVPDAEPSIRSRRLYIPLNLWYMLASTEAFPLLCVGENQLTIQIECRAIRELFTVRDMAYYSRTYWWCSADNKEPLFNSQSGCTTPHYNTDVSFAGVPYTSTMTSVDPRYQMYLFLTQEATSAAATIIANAFAFLPNAQSNWYADPHLMCTYAFLDNPERQVLRSKPQSYLVQEIHEYNLLTTRAKTITRTRFSSAGLVATWMWFFQRSDVDLRNEWSNYTNWAYRNWLPFMGTPMYDPGLSTANPDPAPIEPYQGLANPVCYPYYGLKGGVLGGPSEATGNPGLYFAATAVPATGQAAWGEGMFRYPPYFPYTYTKDPSGVQPKITGPYHDFNDKFIMENWSLWCDGKLRENTLDAGILDNVEKYFRANGGLNEGCYFYNFGLNTNPNNAQPNGAMNLILFKDIEFEYETLHPPMDLSSQQLVVCAAVPPGGVPQSNNSNLLGINSATWRVHQFDYNLYIMEERYNLLTIENGLVGLKFTHHR